MPDDSDLRLAEHPSDIGQSFIVAADEVEAVVKPLQPPLHFLGGHAGTAGGRIPGVLVERLADVLLHKLAAVVPSLPPSCSVVGGEGSVYLVVSC